MTLRLPFRPAALALLAAPVLLAAQTSSSEEERLEKLMADSAQWYVPKTTVSIGFRMLNSGGKVQYGNLGSVPLTVTLHPISEGPGNRDYNNGSVGLDALRLNEKDSNGNQVALDANGRYQTKTAPTDGTSPVVNGDYLGYQQGRTRIWSYVDDSQIMADGRIAMSSYSATSEGGSALKDTAGSAGVEFALTRRMGQLMKRAEWGITAGIALNGINNKTSGSVLATLHTNTDYYSLNGQAAPPPPYNSTGAFDDYTATNGVVYTDALETTVPLSAVPQSSTTTVKAGGTTVNGTWQVKGAYFMVRLGPSVRAQLSERFGLNLSIGLAGAFAGSTYSVVESFSVPNIDELTITTPDTEKSSTSKFLSGYYADLNLEWAATERTGLFGGVSAQQFTDYNQPLNGRTARIDLGSSVGLRGGISIKF